MTQRQRERKTADLLTADVHLYTDIFQCANTSVYCNIYEGFHFLQSLADSFKVPKVLQAKLVYVILVMVIKHQVNFKKLRLNCKILLPKLLFEIFRMLTIFFLFVQTVPWQEKVRVVEMVGVWVSGLWGLVFSQKMTARIFARTNRQELSL